MRPHVRYREIWLAVAVAGTAWACPFSISMPGDSYEGPRPSLTPSQQALRQELERHIETLAIEIGERNLDHPEQLERAAKAIEEELRSYGYEPKRRTFDVRGTPVSNIEVVSVGTTAPQQQVVIGAHYDSAQGCPAANDNGTGVAALLALAKRFRERPGKRTLRWVAFVNEEPPYFRTPDMGSKRYAQMLKKRKSNVVAMLSLETIGYFTNAPDTQHYPFPFSLFYPSVGNFIAFVANPDSADLLRHVVDTYRAQAKIPSEGAAAPASIPGIDWSDQQGFWEVGYPGIMVTDTAINRYRHYHEPTDTPDKLDFDGFTLTTDGLIPVIDMLQNSETL